jgi:hypothetical protein
VQVLHGEDEGVVRAAREEHLPNGLEGAGLAGFRAEMPELVNSNRQAQ